MSPPGPGCRQVPKPLSPPPTTRHKGIIKDHQVFRQQDWNLSEGSLLGRLPWCSINNILSVPTECQRVECWLSRLPCFFHLVSSCLKLDHVGTFSSPLLELQSVETDCTRGHMIHMWLRFGFFGSRFWLHLRCQHVGNQQTLDHHGPHICHMDPYGAIL